MSLNHTCYKKIPTLIENNIFFLIVALWRSQMYQEIQEFQQKSKKSKVIDIQTQRLKPSSAHSLSTWPSQKRTVQMPPEAPSPSPEGQGDH